MGGHNESELRQLEEQFARAMEQLYVVGNGLAALRQRTDASAGLTTPAPAPTGIVPTAPPGAPATSAPQLSTAPARLAAPSAQLQPQTPPIPGVPGVPGVPRMTGPGHVPAYAPIPAPPRVPLWEREGFVTRVLGFTGAFVTLIGVVMFLVLAIQQGWLGPIGRVVAGWVLALGLIGAAQVVRGREHKAGRAGHGAVAIAATGYAAAFLCVVAMTSIYGWLPAAAGLALAAVVTATGLVIARQWNSQALAVVLVLSAIVFAPFVTARASWVLSAFVVVVAVASWPLQLGRSWPLLTVARTVPAPLVLVPTGIIAAFDGERWGQLGVTVVFAVAGALMAIIDSRTKDHRELVAATLSLASLPLFFSIGALDFPWTPIGYAVAALCWLALAGAGEASKRWPSAVTVPAVSLGTLALVLAILARDEPRWNGTLLLAAATAYLLVAGATRSRLATWSGLVVTGLALATYLRHPVTVLVESTAVNADLTVVIVDSVLTAVVVVALVWLTVRSRELTQRQRRMVRAVAWFVGLSVATTALVGAGVLFGGLLDNRTGGFRAGHALATILWMSTAIFLLSVGLRRAKDARMSVWLGLALAAVSVGKLFLYDLAVLTGLWRVLAFIVVGLMLLAAGTGYAKALERARRQPDAGSMPSAPSPPMMQPSPGEAPPAQGHLGAPPMPGSFAGTSPQPGPPPGPSPEVRPDHTP